MAFVRVYVHGVTCPEDVEFWLSPPQVGSGPRPTGNGPQDWIRCTAVSGKSYCYGSKIVTNGRYVLYLKNANCWASPVEHQLAGTVTLNLYPSRSAEVAVSGVTEQLDAFDGKSFEEVMRIYEDTVKPQNDYRVFVEWTEERDDGGEVRRCIKGGYELGKPNECEGCS